MNAGHFNRRIRIERQDGRLDAWGQPLEAWQPVAELWTAITADATDSGQPVTLDGKVNGTGQAVRPDRSLHQVVLGPLLDRLKRKFVVLM